MSRSGFADESVVAKGEEKLVEQVTMNEAEWESFCATASGRPQSEIRVSSFRPKDDILKVSDSVCRRHGFARFFDVAFISEDRIARAYFGEGSLVVASWPGTAKHTLFAFYGSESSTAAAWQDEMVAAFGAEKSELKISAGDTTKEGPVIPEKTANP